MEGEGRPEAVATALRVVLHDMKNQLGVAIGTIALVREGAVDDSSNADMALTSLQHLDRSVSLLQECMRDHLEAVEDFGLRDFLVSFAMRARKVSVGQDLADTIEALIEAHASDWAPVQVRAPSSALYDTLVKSLFAPASMALRLQSIALRDVRGDELLEDGRYVEFRMQPQSGAENIESEILREQLVLRFRGADFGRAREESDVWLLRLPIVSAEESDNEE